MLKYRINDFLGFLSVTLQRTCFIGLSLFLQISSGPYPYFLKFGDSINLGYEMSPLFSLGVFKLFCTLRPCFCCMLLSFQLLGYF